MQSELFTTAPAPEPQTAAAMPTTFAELIKAVRELKNYSFEQFCELRDFCTSNETAILLMINKLTIKEIGQVIYIMRSGNKKEDLVQKCYDSIVSSFSISNDGMISYSPFDGQTYKGELLKKFAQHTPEMFEAWKEAKRQKAAAFKKAMENPETLEEFTTFVNRKGVDQLTTEQLERYDELRTGISREQKAREQERKAKITGVAMEETEMIIIPTTHTKKNIPLWVVRLSERVEKYIFKDLNDRAKQLGGYYSSYRGGGAIPGFTFEREEAAKLFIQIKDGDINAIELRQAINAERSQQKAENLQDKAESINERATEELNKDRKDNTARRARMASGAESRAAAEIVFSNTLNKIAEGNKAGTIKYLDKLGDIVQLEELEAILSRCKWDYIRDKNIREGNFEFTPEVIEYAKFPYPVLYKEHIMGTLNKLQYDKGKMMAAKRIVKWVNRLKPEQEYLTITGGKSLEDFRTLFLYPSKGIDKYECERYKHANNRLKRINRLGITTIFELRTALRELVKIKEGTQLTPEQVKAQQLRELDRKFVTLKIDGFFPTPAILAAEVVEKAGIVEGDRILEPSAGLGHLAEAITAAHPDNHLFCMEIYQPLAEALELKGFNALCNDFMACAGVEEATKYDKIIMNPPFENLQDIDHVLQAWNKFLKPGGRIVAIMANNKHRDTTKVKEFMQLVDNYGTYEENPTGSFSSSFRPTGVNTITVVLDKP